jgi:CDP-4-dehydro-6-deoxyglucose reductase
MRLVCSIASIEYFNADTRRLLLQIPDGTSVDFKAGQYLEIILPEKNCPFSIANAPHVHGLIELHVRPTPGSADSVLIERLLDTATEVEIEIPRGNVFMDSPPTSPLILLAASTGITQMKSIFEHLIHLNHQLPVHLYWGVVSATDLYLDDLCRGWQSQYPHFNYVPVVSDPASSPGWNGQTGLVGEVALGDFDDLSDVIVYVSGGPGMVYATLDAFVAKGLPAGNMFSDIFTYAPRPPLNKTS